VGPNTSVTLGPCRVDIASEGRNGAVAARWQLSCASEIAQRHIPPVRSVVLDRYEHGVRCPHEPGQRTPLSVAQRRIVEHGGGTAAAAVTQAGVDDSDRQATTSQGSVVSHGLSVSGAPS
jgi:hypothetical protein